MPVPLSEGLPPRELWPERLYTLPETRSPARLNVGDRVLVRLPNGPEFVVTWLACQKLGVIPVSTMPLLRARELACIVQDAGTRVAVPRTETGKIRRGELRHPQAARSLA